MDFCLIILLCLGTVVLLFSLNVFFMTFPTEAWSLGYLILFFFYFRNIVCLKPIYKDACHFLLYLF